MPSGYVPKLTIPITIWLCSISIRTNQKDRLPRSRAKAVKTTAPVTVNSR